MRLQYKAELFRPNLIGQRAPEFSLPDLNDQPVALKNFKAKYTLLYFYSPLCTRCREVTPDVHALTKNYLAKGLRVLAVTTDCPDKNYWKTYVRQNLGDWTCVLELGKEPSELERLYATAQLPNVYFLDENKKIVLKRVPVERLQDFLDAWVK
jgi:thiol-disulfide isomerase/thioredoxin